MSIIKKIVARMKRLIDKENIEFTGDFKTWSEAELLAEGYDSQEIFDKITNAALQVRDGKAEYERDSVLFYKRNYNYPLLTWLFIASHDNRLAVLDWGGALGCTYFQNRKIFEDTNINIAWYIKEQQHFVDFGKRELESSSLHFIDGMSEIYENIDVVLLSGVLQYLENYQDVIKSIIDILGPKMIILERTPVAKKTRITIEEVPEQIYRATYVHRFFTEDQIIEKFNNYELKDTWHSLVDSDIVFDGNEVATWMSFVLVRKR